MSMNPYATITMNNGTKIVIELLPEVAKNTVNSFIHAIQAGVYNQHSIERIVPEAWIDASYTAFGKEAAKYLIPYESDLHPEIEPKTSCLGVICMGGYGELGLSGCEFFFPLKDCPEHKGIYPVFGKVVKGIEEIIRISKEVVVPVTDFPYADIEINRPVKPQVIEKVELELHDYIADKPILKADQILPECWKN